MPKEVNLNGEVIMRHSHRMKSAKVDLNNTDQVIAFLGEEIDRLRRRIQSDEEMLYDYRTTNAMQARDISFWKAKYEEAVRDKGIIASFDRADLEEAIDNIGNIQEELNNISKLFQKYNREDNA